LVCFDIYYPDFYYLFFVLNATPPTEIYTLSLHDALPILTFDDKNQDGNIDYYNDENPEYAAKAAAEGKRGNELTIDKDIMVLAKDRKSTRLNSSHVKISYAVFCLKKKK